jgi:hypothetical protein
MNTADLIRKMSAAGASPEAIAIACEWAEQAIAEARADFDHMVEKRRETWRELKKNQRAKRGMSTGHPLEVHETSTGLPRTSSPPSPPSSPSEVLPPSPYSTNNTPPLLTPSSPTPAPSPRGAQARGTRLPEGWEPDEAGRAFAADGLGARWAAELETFRDYWSAQPGEKGRKVDWSATWRNWCRRAGADRKSPYRGTRSMADVWAARAIEAERREAAQAATAKPSYLSQLLAEIH